MRCRRIIRGSGIFRQAGGYFDDPKNRRLVALILAAFLGLAAVSAWKGEGQGKWYVVGRNGEVAGVRREDPGEAAVFYLTVRWKENGKSRTRDLTLTMDALAEKKASSKEGKESTEEMLEEAMEEASGKNRLQVILPDKLKDGTRLRWSRQRNLSGLRIALLGPILAALLIWNDRKKGRDRRAAEQRSVACGLPAFHDQMLLLLDSGLVLRDAFLRASAGYQESDSRYFRHVIAKVRRDVTEEQMDFVRALRQAADRERNKLLSGFSITLAECQERGTDLTTQLRTESRLLWQERKRIAVEEGRKAETKLTFPLSLLLFSLVLITTAPAFLQVKGGSL